MAVRRLHPEQPASFAFNAENLAWAKDLIGRYPPGKQASAVIPLLWRAQEQHDGWLPEPAIRAVADMLGMAYIRVYEVATFYTMFQLAPVGRKAHVQVCGTTPCMLRGSEALIEVCKRRIAGHAHEVSADGDFSWEEVECLGSCANAPMVQIWKDTYEDLTPELLEKVLDGFAGKGPMAKPGSQTGRQASCPAGGPTTLKTPIERPRYLQPAASPAAAGTAVSPAAVATLDPPSSAAAKVPTAAVAAAKPVPEPLTAAAALAALAPGAPDAAAGGPATTGGLASESVVVEPGRSGGSVPGVSGLAAEVIMGTDPATGESGPQRPLLLPQPRDGVGDDLSLIWGVAEKLAGKLNGMGIWHFDQIAQWTPANVAWFEAELEGFKGRVARDKWIEQCQKLATGWRPDNEVGQRPKG